MLLELGRTLSFFLSLLSLFPVLVSAFFEPGSRWQERLTVILLNCALAACICFASGLLFSWPARTNPDAGQPLLSTLPVRMFLWAMAAMAVLFALSWYLEVYYLPLIPHDCCRRP
jgi:hypothetical protein